MTKNTYLRFDLGNLSAEEIGQLQSDIREALGDTGKFTWRSLTGSNQHLDGVATEFRQKDTNRDGVPEALLLKVQPGGGNNAFTELSRHTLGTAFSAAKCSSGAVLSCASVVLDASSIPSDVKQFKNHRELAAHWQSEYNVGRAAGEALFDLLLQYPEGPPADTGLGENPTDDEIAKSVNILQRDDQGRATRIATAGGAQLGIRWNDDGSVALHNPQTGFAMSEVTHDDFEQAQRLPAKSKAAAPINLQ